MKEITFVEKHLDFCNVKIYEDYICVTMNEGVTVIPAYNDILVDITKEYYLKKNFVYLSNRKNSYSVDPTIYLETSKIVNLKGFIVVDKKETTAQNHQVEKLFFDKPFAVVKTLKDAIIWKDNLLYN